MKKSVCSIFLSVFLVVLNSCANQMDNYVSIQGYAQGGTYSVTLNLKGVDVPAEEAKKPSAF